MGSVAVLKAQEHRSLPPPDASAVLRRFVILKNLFVKALAVPPHSQLADVMTQWSPEERERFDAQLRQAFDEQTGKLRELGLWDEMSDAERKFMQAMPLEVDAQAIIDNMWLSESAVCLLWSLGYVECLPSYDRQADPKLANRLPRESMKALESQVTLRPSDEIERQRGIAELWHWRCRARSLRKERNIPTGSESNGGIEAILQRTAEKGAADGLLPLPIDGDFPAFGKPYREITEQEFFLATSIAIERHRAFNWLCGYAPGNDWAQTPIDA
jgi:Domain of unknown function (DUF4272)